ncbi:TonB-dependent receptor [Cyclobacterium amurskyense]|uniref:TonB-dependent receptor n=1 Tax=Cyclobacterium amurskyense TaxID=320787 RepID=UPI0030DB8CF9|tara:strand:+ start:8946 stop:9452 length:507 start_codon:yes stop_codon:yes gene_type:complete
MKYFLLVVGLALVPFSSILAQETSKGAKEKLEITIKESDNPDVYIDGKKYDHSIIDLLDTDKIASVDVIKGERAISEYNAPNGVIIIKTKAKANQVRIRNSNGNLDENQPLIIIDGVTAEKGDLEKLDPIDIESVEVLKGENAMKKHNAPNGVVLIITKGAVKSKKKE